MQSDSGLRTSTLYTDPLPDVTVAVSTTLAHSSLFARWICKPAASQSSSRIVDYFGGDLCQSIHLAGRKECARLRGPGRSKSVSVFEDATIGDILQDSGRLAVLQHVLTVCWQVRIGRQTR